MKFLTTTLSVPLLLAGSANGHGHITLPPARNNGSVDFAGNCDNFACMWFSQVVEIPGKPTLPHEARTINVDVATGGDNDFTAKMPWRAPGTAPVIGSGCGSAGGGPIPHNNGGIPPPGIKQGADFLTLPETAEPTVWKRGSVQEVAWATFANHGGGYSWRLCPKTEEASEECFLNHTLRFSGDKSWLRYQPFYQYENLVRLPDYEIPALRVTEGTYPKGAMWTRNPVPACKFCDQGECTKKYKTFDEQQMCAQSCSGLNVTGRSCPPGTAVFPEPLPGISGYYKQDCFLGGRECDGLAGFEYNIVDKVEVPTDIPQGDYLLSWRWDCEQSRQIWQNCADLRIE